MPIICIEPTEETPGYKFEVSSTELAQLRTHTRKPAPRSREVLEERIGRKFTQAEVNAAEASYKASRSGSDAHVKTLPRTAVSRPRVPARRSSGQKPSTSRRGVAPMTVG